jgi:hypothetical protein
VSRSVRFVPALTLLSIVGCSGGAPSADAGGPDAAARAQDAGARVEAGKPTVADELLGRDRDALLDAWVKAIGNLEVVSNAGLARLGTNWSEQLAVTRARFHAAVSAEDVYYALLSLQRSYHDFHSELILPSPNRAKPSLLRMPANGPPAVLPIDVTVDYSAGPTKPAYVVDWVEPGLDMGVHAGDIIVTVDSNPIGAVERALMEFVGASSPEFWRESVAVWLSYRYASDLPQPLPYTPIRFGFTDSAGENPHDATLTWILPTSSAPPPVDPCTVAAEVAPNSDYLALVPELVGIHLCVYGSSTSRKVVRWFSFLYEFSDYSGGDPSFGQFSSLTARMKAMSYAIPSADLPFVGASGPGQMLDPVGMMKIDLAHLVTFLQGAGDPSLLIDVRENGGGNFDPSIISAFATAPAVGLATQIVFGPSIHANPNLLDGAVAPGPQASLAKAYLLAHPMAATSPLYPFICETSACNISERTIAPATSPLTGGAALFTGPDCVSACDDFVASLHDNGLATSIGMPTCGADSPVRVPLELTLTDGTTKVSLELTVGENLRPGGQILEGHPPHVDVPLYPTKANAGKYLAAALSALP